MTGFNEKDGVLCAEDTPLPLIAENVGTPCYIYSAEIIRSQYRKLRDAMQNALPEDRQPLFCYACKANSNLAILSLLRNEGCGLEIVSEGELHRGIKAGISPKRLYQPAWVKHQARLRPALTRAFYSLTSDPCPSWNT